MLGFNPKTSGFSDVESAINVQSLPGTCAVVADVSCISLRYLVYFYCMFENFSEMNVAKEDLIQLRNQNRCCLGMASNNIQPLNSWDCSI